MALRPAFMASASSDSIDPSSYRDVLEAIPDPAILVGRGGRILATNAAALALTGNGPGGLVGSAFATIIPPRYHKHHPLLGTSPGLAAMPGGRIRLDLQVMRTGGQDVPVELVMTPVGDRRGLALCVLHEVAGEAAGPAEVQRLREMAEFRARFLNMAAHELKTPLTPIRLQVQLLHAYLGEAPENVQRSLTILGRSVDRLNALIEDVLDAARIQASQLRLRQDAVSLSAIAAEAAESYAAVADEVGLVLESTIAPGVNVIGDRGRLLQVANNLVSNAIKYTPSPGKVLVTVSQEESEGVLAVRDTGRGMTPEQGARLFQPFTQLHPDAAATVKGTGLGLYISKSIVEQHGGSIAVASKGEGKGTTVTVRLPLTSRAPTSEQVRPSPRSTKIRDRLREMV